MANPGQPTIRLGDVGDVVRRLQRALRRLAPLEYPAPDGVFGPRTEFYVRNFQAGDHLVVDGVVGPATWAALPGGAPMPVLQRNSHGPVVASLQTVLAGLAATEPDWHIPSPGGADGQFGPLTQASVEAFQTAGHHGLSPDGIVGDYTWAAAIPLGEPLDMAVGLEFVIG
jgi:peptidoglycan hydrolase-like protein with peptidoglycan-binding domain